MFMQVGSFCTSDLSSGIAIQQDSMIHKTGSLMRNILAADASCPLCLHCSAKQDFFKVWTYYSDNTTQIQ